MREIIPYAEIAKFCEELRAEFPGIKIVFTNGVFDLVHRGHVEYLEKAKNYGDLLILGLNSDVSAKHLKGQGRPYLGEDDRAYILSRLESVDVVCIFDEDTPLNLIKKVKPNVLIKGGDYQINEIVGRDFVEQSGGIVQTIPLTKGKSTTNLLKKIKSS